MNFYVHLKISDNTFIFTISVKKHQVIYSMNLNSLEEVKY